MRDYNDEDDNKAIEILEWREKDLERHNCYSGETLQGEMTV